MEEIWRTIEGFEDYQVSNLGRVKSLKYNKERIMKPGVGSHGYVHVGLRLNGKRSTKMVHQLVAVAFIGHTPCGHRVVVDHINHDNSDNRLTNLQLISQRDNVVRGKLTQGGSSNYVGVDWYKRFKKWRAQIRINGKKKFIGLFTDELEASQAYQDALKKEVHHGI